MHYKSYLKLAVLLPVCGFMISSCAEVSVPDARNVEIPSPVTADKRRNAINERPDSVMYLPLGEDVLVPSRITGGSLPDEKVGPFELRSETLAGALQLILADYDISIAFETEEGLSRKVTVANLNGPLGRVVNRVCSLADLYCSFEDGGLIVKDRQTFTVTLPPLADAEGGDEFIDDTIQGLSAVLGEGGSTPISDPTTRTIIYSATARTSKLAENYFQRLRANTAMVVFETYIWEVSLDSNNATGINYSFSEELGKFQTSFDITNRLSEDLNPISIGLPQTMGATPADILDFISNFGAVKTISQPQITMLSGANAELRVADTENYVAEVTSTISGDQTSTSVSTASVDSGFTLSIGSQWDKSTVYANININLTNVDEIEDFTFAGSSDEEDASNTRIQLPRITERELTTQIRVRPGDSVLIGGLVRETDNFDSTGPGFMEPILPTNRAARTQNLELVILMRPRVVVYTANDDKRYLDFVDEKKRKQISSLKTDATMASPKLQSTQKKAVSAVSEENIIAVKAPTPIVEVEPIVSEDRQVKVDQEERKIVSTLKDVTSSYVSRKSYEPIRPTVSVEKPVVELNAPSSVIEIDSSGADTSGALSPEIFNQAEPLNVYEAYERSKNSYYSTKQ